MLHEVLLALLGNAGGVFKDKGNGLQVQSGLPFLHPAEIQILNKLGKLATQYRDLTNFVRQYRGGLSISSRDKKHPEGIHGLYLRAFCTGLDKFLEGYMNDVLSLQQEIMKDPVKPLSFLLCNLQDYQLLFTAMNVIIEEIISHKAHGCYILDIINRHSQTGHPLLKQRLTRILHVCHGVMYKQLCSWLLCGYIYDPYHEFFIQPSSEQSADQTSQSQEEEEEDYLGLTGVTGRQLQKLLQTTVTESSNTMPHLFSVMGRLLPSYLSVRVANKILFVGESIQMFENKDRQTASQKSTILQGKVEDFAKELHLLSKEEAFNPVHFESLINKIRTHVAEHLWLMLVQDSDLLGNLRVIKDFYLLGRGELYLAFIDQAQHLLRMPPTKTSESDVNTAFLQAARSVLYHDEALLSRFWLTVKVPAKQHTRRDSSSSSSSGQSASVETGWSCLGLSYTVQWPLHAFLTPPVLDKYNQVFRFLLAVRLSQMNLQQCWSIQMQGKKNCGYCRDGTMKWQLHRHMSFLVDNLQYYLQVDVIESQYSTLVEKVNNTRDYEAVKLAHDQFLSALLAESFVHMKPVAHCLDEILDQCNVFAALVSRCETPMSSRDTKQLEQIAKSFQRQSSLLFKMLSSVRGHSSSPHLTQLLLRLDFNKYFSVSGGQFGGF